MSYFRDNVERADGYVPGYQPKAADVVKLNTNENPYPPSPRVLEALAEIRPEQLRRYPDPLGNAFREAAAELNGLRPVAYPVPTYSLYPVLANLEGCPTVEIPFDEEFNLPARLAKTQAALTIVCNPNAPTATFVRIEELASLADELAGVLLVDEAYVDFAEQDGVELVREFDNVVILRSMSKGYSLAGIRFGYAMAQKDLIAGLLKVKDSYNVDAVAIALATAAVKDQSYFRENVEKVKKARRTLTEQLRSLGFEVADSCTNFVLARVKDASASAIHEQLAERNIFVRYFNSPGLSDKLRISIGTEEQHERLLAALREILSQQGA